MALKKRKPSGEKKWPSTLIAGASKAGKSWACAEASSDPRIHSTFWLNVGEVEPDEYASIPGVDFDIIDYDGTLIGNEDSFIETLSLVLAEGIKDADKGKTDLLVIDSFTNVWELVMNKVQSDSNEKIKKAGVDATLTSASWRRANAYMDSITSLYKAFPGPVILTERLEPVSETEDRIRGQKNVPFDVDAVIEMPERGTTRITGLRSTVTKFEKPQTIDDFSMSDLWNNFGFTLPTTKSSKKAA